MYLIAFPIQFSNRLTSLPFFKTIILLNCRDKMLACLISGTAEYKLFTTSFSTGLSFNGDLNKSKAALVGKYKERLSGHNGVPSAN